LLPQWGRRSRWCCAGRRCGSANNRGTTVCTELSIWQIWRPTISTIFLVDHNIPPLTSRPQRIELRFILFKSRFVSPCKQLKRYDLAAHVSYVEKLSLAHRPVESLRCRADQPGALTHHTRAKDVKFPKKRFPMPTPSIVNTTANTMRMMTRTTSAIISAIARTNPNRMPNPMSPPKPRCINSSSALRGGSGSSSLALYDEISAS